MNCIKHIKLIANPVSGGRALKKILRCRDLLEETGATVELFLTTAAGDAEKAAAESQKGGFDLIVAAGGDGTLNEVINGMAPCTTPLAFIPLGTTNVFALEVGIPFDLKKACRIALKGEARPVGLGLADGRRFLLMASAGFDAEVVRTADSRVKRHTGKAAYVWGALNVFFFPPATAIEAELEDGSRHRAYGAVIGNSRLYGGLFSLTPQADLGEEGLQVCLISRPGRRHLLRVVLNMLLRRSPTAAGALLIKTRRLRLHGNGVPVQLDGDFFGHLPLDFRSTFGDIRLVMPQTVTSG